MKKLNCAALSAFIISAPLAAFAAESAPEAGLARIPWAMKNSGAMPKGLTIGLAALVGMIIITVMYAKFTSKGDKSDE